ncbi:hypothetical protein D3C80_1817800 [compost metagenome]
MVLSESFSSSTGSSGPWVMSSGLLNTGLPCSSQMDAAIRPAMLSCLLATDITSLTAVW